MTANRADPTSSPIVSGILLAAGLSRRMGEQNKLLLEIEGTPLVRLTCQTALEAGLDLVVVVVGHQADLVRRALDGLDLAFAENERPDAGLSSSIRAGVSALEALAPRTAGALVLLGDMPWVRASDVRALLAAFDPTAGREICVPTHAGRRGNPVMWSTRFFPELKALSGDAGARGLMERHADSVVEVEVEGAGVLRDLDTPEAYEALGPPRPAVQ